MAMAVERAVSAQRGNGPLRQTARSYVPAGALDWPVRRRTKVRAPLVSLRLFPPSRLPRQPSLPLGLLPLCS